MPGHQGLGQLEFISTNGQPLNNILEFGHVGPLNTLPLTLTPWILADLNSNFENFQKNGKFWT